MTGEYIRIKDLVDVLADYGRIYSVTDNADTHATMGMVIGDLRRLAAKAIDPKDVVARDLGEVTF